MSSDDMIGWAVPGQPADGATPEGRAVLSACSRLSVLSSGSDLSVLSAGSTLSAASAGSILSVGSAGSILSVGSIGSILSVGSAFSILSKRSAFAMFGRGDAFTMRRGKGTGAARRRERRTVHLVTLTALGCGLTAALLTRRRP